jgi:hypothetical protein
VNVFICNLFKDFVCNLDYIVSNERMIKELEKMWKEPAFAEFMVLYRQLQGGTDKNYENPDRERVSRPRFETDN